MQIREWQMDKKTAGARLIRRLINCTFPVLAVGAPTLASAPDSEAGSLPSIAAHTSAQLIAQTKEDEPDVTVEPRSIVSEEVEPLALIPLAGELAPRVDELIGKLGAFEYDVRQSATDELIELGVPAFPRLRDAYVRSDDLEVRLRIEEIVHAGYLDYMVYNQKGFLGVGVRLYRPTGPNDPQLDPSTKAVRLTIVHEGTAAAGGGLEPNDIIFQMDGEPLGEAELDEADMASGRLTDTVVRYFSQQIASRRPNERLHLKFYRDGAITETVVTLGRAPESMVRSGSIQVVKAALDEANDKFLRWWKEHFIQALGAAGDERS